MHKTIGQGAVGLKVIPREFGPHRHDKSAGHLWKKNWVQNM